MTVTTEPTTELTADLIAPEGWEHAARCRLGNPYDIDPDLFWPVGNSAPAREQEKLAKIECAQCPVASLCLARGLEQPEGVWGGTTPEERAALRRNRARVAA